MAAKKNEVIEAPAVMAEESKLDMVLRELAEIRRENAALTEWVRRMVRKGRTI